MPIATHQFPSAETLEAEYQRSLGKIGRMTELAKTETADTRSAYRSLSNESKKCGTIASVLMNDGDATARRHMADAERYGRRLLTEVGYQPRVSEIEVIHRRGGPTSIVEHEVSPASQSRPLAIHYFYDVLLTTLAFGDASALAQFATFPEAGYRSPNMSASEGFYALMRVYQAWLSGKERQARAEIEIVLRYEQGESVRAEMDTLRAIMSRDERAFQSGLQADLTAFKRAAKKQAHDPSVMICWSALALARLAKAQNLPVADDGYLPARLLPDGPIR
jgi:hypothetical protein